MEAPDQSQQIEPLHNVQSLHGAVIGSDRKAVFLNMMGACFDNYARTTGAEPEAAVLVMGGLKQAFAPGWHLTGDSEGGTISMLALAAACLQSAITRSHTSPTV